MSLALSARRAAATLLQRPQMAHAAATAALRPHGPPPAAAAAASAAARAQHLAPRRGADLRRVLARQLRANSSEAEKETEKENGADAEETPAKEGEEKDPKQKEIDDLKKSLAYALAEADNARKIARKDVENAKQYALKSFAKDLLEVADNMERAMGSVKATEAEDPKVKALLEGIRLTHTSLNKCFEANGITRMEVAEGTEFDPSQHDALYNIPWAEGKQPGTVGNVIKSGYNYRGRVLRAAQCGVVAGKEEDE
eukprot:TRINITY_DN10434_c0_g1_i1.p1 TRINITY_DN10434_c0_g1~~TRINITY_DN10434_c0_g1_i1.p1  ORF type:complete len:281 (+),score=109.01 TRINITY_DN10434_c0_g1_i1:80-844(+)